MKEYILSIIAAAIVCAVVQGFLGKKTATGRLATLLSSILMAVTVIAPLGKLTFDGISDFWTTISADGEKYVMEGTVIAEKQKENIIKSQTEAYILDKADQMDLQIAVEVELDGDNGNIPCSVVISGGISPYAQKQLGAYIEDTLGIAKENQKWK